MFPTSLKLRRSADHTTERVTVPVRGGALTVPRSRRERKEHQEKSLQEGGHGVR